MALYVQEEWKLCQERERGSAVREMGFNEGTHYVEGHSGPGVGVGVKVGVGV